MDTSRRLPLLTREAAFVAAVSIGAAALLCRWACRPASAEADPRPTEGESLPRTMDRVEIFPDEPGKLEDDVSSANMAEVFIRGINKKATVESITEHFSGAGEILSLRWTSGPKTERKGYCK